MPEEQDPPRKFYGLKEAEFEAVNQRSDHQPRIDVREHFQNAALSGIPAAKPAPKDNDVHAILRDNLARANAAGLNELAEKPKRPSKRKRDYWTLMLAGNGFFVVAGILRGGVSAIFGGAGIILFTIGVTWVMWFVMDDY